MDQQPFPRTSRLTSNMNKRLDPYRYQLNLSQVCARGLEREVSIMEGLSCSLGDIDELVEEIGF